MVADDWAGVVRTGYEEKPRPGYARAAAALGGPDGRLAAGLAELLAGTLDRAEAVLRDAARDPGAGQDLVRDRRLCPCRHRAAHRPRPVRSRRAGSVVLDAEVADRPWWARLGCALLEADAGHLTALDLMRAQAEAEEDLWGSGIIRLLRGIVAHEADALEDAAAVFGRLDAPVLQSVGKLPGRRRWQPKEDRTWCSRPAPRQGLRRARSAGGGPAMGRPDRQRHAPRSPRSAQPEAAQLRVLGGFELTIGGVPVDQFAVRPRARKALHVLALARRPARPP